MSRRARLSPLLCLLMMFPAGPAAASGPRLDALGGDGAYLEDARNVRHWYGSLVDYPDLTTLQSGQFDQHQGYARHAGRRMEGPDLGLHLGLGGHGVLAAYGTERLNGTELEPSRAWLAGPAWQLAYARPVGGVDLALSWRHAMPADVVCETEGVRNESRQDVVGLGARWELGDRAYLDAAADLGRLAATTHADGEPDREQSNWGDYGLRVRGFVAVGTSGAVVPLLEYRNDRRDWDLCGTDRDIALDHWRLGAAWTWLPDPDHLLLASVDYRATDEEWEGILYEEDVLALRLAAEARIHAFLSLRAATGWERVRSDLGPSDADHVPLSAGLAVHAGPVDVDLAWSNLPPHSARGSREPWQAADDSTWMSAAVGVAF